MSKNENLVLGIDPGTAITGYGLVWGEGDNLRLVDYGTITTPSDESQPQRLQEIYRQLTALIQERQPAEAAVEKLFFSRNVRTALSVGQARGVALLAMANADLDIHEYTPLEVKQAVVGYGRATKEQVQEMVKVLLGLDSVPQPDDAADAIAVAICHIHSAHMRDLIRSSKLKVQSSNAEEIWGR
ncbi:MAG: crossover junction endodeoxyribonuclease RuvC [Anaerolineales bacterium]|nr:crossover junction endodeoxyribonuclease RuvC [Anaerolineales bacterium]